MRNVMQNVGNRRSDQKGAQNAGSNVLNVHFIVRDIFLLIFQFPLSAFWLSLSQKNRSMSMAIPVSKSKNICNMQNRLNPGMKSITGPTQLCIIYT